MKPIEIWIGFLLYAGLLIMGKHFEIFHDIGWFDIGVGIIIGLCTMVLCWDELRGKEKDN